MARFRGSEAEAAGYGVDKLQGRPPSVGEFSSPSQFQILKELHSSAAGSVHLAKVKDPQSQLKDTVVLKKRKVPELGKAKDMFNEYEVMKRLSHPNIIRCYGYFWEFPTQSLYIVLEYANRGDLHGELQTRKRLGKHFSDNEVWDVLAQVLRGLRHIHARGIVHRDIKTMNLLLNDEGVIKLGDFGVSRQMSENTVCLHSFYGTPLYLSPELIEGRAYSRTTDIWSLGVVLYELLSLQLPFRGPSLQDVIAAVLRCRFAPLPSWRPQEFSDVVNSMLTKDAQRRPSAESLLQRMESLGKLFRPPKAVQEDPRPVEPKPPDKENRSPAAVARNEGHQVVRVRSRPSSAGPQVKLIEPDAAPPGATGPLHVVKNLREERWEQRRLAHAPAPYAVEKLQGRPSSIGEFNHREQFEILKDLQSNDSGSVHVARIKKGEELVVLKRRRAPELGKAKDLLNEYEIMKKLHHSNIIRCYGYFWDFPSQSLYIVLEYANRGDLHWELQKRKRLGKPFGDEEVWDILAQVLMGLCHIHARGIVHRDIKAMNLFLTSHGVIKLGDFGVSRQMSEKTLCLQSFYGTPLYFSPEMIEGQTYTNTTDIWSLGVVLYELLTLELPFKGKSLQDVIAAVLRGQYTPIPSYRPQEFSQIVSTMLTRDPAKRPTAEMLLRRLSRSGKLRANSAAAKMVEALSPEPSLSGDLRREPEFHGAAPRPLPPWETAEEVVRVRRRPASAGPQAKPPTKVPTPPVSDSSSGWAAARPRDQRWEQRRQARFMESGTDQDSRDTDTTVEPGPVAPAGLTRPMPKAR